MVSPSLPEITSPHAFHEYLNSLFVGRKLLHKCLKGGSLLGGRRPAALHPKSVAMGTNLCLAHGSRPSQDGFTYGTCGGQLLKREATMKDLPHDHTKAKRYQGYRIHAPFARQVEKISKREQPE